MSYQITEELKRLYPNEPVETLIKSYHKACKAFIGDIPIKQLDKMAITFFLLIQDDSADKEDLH